MNKHCTFFLLLIWTGYIAKAQCPVAPLTLSSQAQVDNFPNDFPGCTRPVVAITITGANITNLNGLNGITGTDNSIFIVGNPQLTSLNGLSNLADIDVELKIENNDALTDLSGLENLASIGGYLNIAQNDNLTSFNGLGPIPSLGSYLYIAFNPDLTDISALSSLGSIAYFLQINNNNSLTSLDGLNGVTTIGQYLNIESNNALASVNALNNLVSVGGNFEIANNPSLTGMNGFTNLASIGGDFSITNNNVLTDLNEFANLTTIGGDVIIASNSALSDCATEGICGYLENPSGSVVITNNASGCSSVAEVEVACAAFPVELTFFRGQHDDDGIVLTWQTASEENNARFEIEHSVHGIHHFRKLGEVAGHGTTSTVQDYTYRHHLPAPGINYYRLKQVDFDGASGYSNILSFVVEHDEPPGVYPNPTTGALFITVYEQDAIFRITDAMGKLIREQAVAGNDLIDLASQPQGVYFVEIQTPNRKFVQKIIKK